MKVSQAGSVVDVSVSELRAGLGRGQVSVIVALARSATAVSVSDSQRLITQLIPASSTGSLLRAHRCSVPHAWIMDFTSMKRDAAQILFPSHSGLLPSSCLTTGGRFNKPDTCNYAPIWAGSLGQTHQQWSSEFVWWLNVRHYDSLSCERMRTVMNWTILVVI